MSKGFWIIAGVLIGLPVFNQLYLPDHPVSVETKTGLIPTGTVDWCKVPVLGAADQGISYILPSMSFRCKEKLDAELRLKEEEEDRVRAGILRGKEIAGALSGRKLPEDNLGLVLPRPEIGGMPDAKAGLVRDGLKRSVFGGMLSECPSGGFLIL
jgi:hypothetical protein